MSYGYPDGCSQSDHDRAFGELGPSPTELAAEADADNDLAEEDAYWDNVRGVELEEQHDEMLANDMEANRPIHDDPDDFNFRRPVCPECEGSGDQLVSGGLPGDYIPEYIPCKRCNGEGVLR